MTDILDAWPFPYEPRSNQLTTMKWLSEQEAKYLLIELPVGCHSKGTKILKHSGEYINVEDISIGDKLLGPDSNPRKVLDTHNGRDMMYNIIPTKGESFIVNGGHILSLKTTKARRKGFDGNTVITISVNDYIKTSNDFKNNIKLYRTEEVTFDNSLKINNNVDPYLMGLLIGDGSICNSAVNITTEDIEIEQEIYRQAKQLGLAIRCDTKPDNTASTYAFSTGTKGGDISTRKKNILMESLKDIGIYGSKSGNKYIPNEYKYGSIQTRKELLAGLIDTDGHYNKQGLFTYTTKSEQLGVDVKFVARSLGFGATTYIRTVNGNEYYDIHISGHLNKIPTKIERKKAKERKQKKRVTVTGFRIEPLEIGEYFGFEVDHDHLYVMEDFTVTHNSGKSNLGITYSHYLGTSNGIKKGDSFILTPQKILQKQYEDSFTNNELVDIASLYGKGNYQCANNKSSCEIGSIIHPKCAPCPHKNAKSKAMLASDTVLNYKLALTSFAHTQTFKDRKLMIMDECHTLEDHLVDFDAVSITEWRCKKYELPFKTHSDIESAIKWINTTYLKKLETVTKGLEADCEHFFKNEGMKLTKKDVQQIREMNQMSEHLDEVLEMALRTIEYINDKFVITGDKTSFQFKRITGAHSFHKHIVPFAERFLFMSSTILDKDGFCEDLGIKPEDTAFLSLGSEFPKENRPIFNMPQMKMNASWKNDDKEEERQQMLTTIKTLLTVHEGETGIIHTGNFAISEWLVENLENEIDQIIYHHNPDTGNDRGAIIEQFLGDPRPSVLISPSITEGLDLVGDLGRFAIIVKVPFPSLADKWIKRRMEMSPKWYQRKALTGIIQGGGRVVRSDKDSGNVYLLDGSFGYLYSNSYPMIPDWWKESYQILT